MCGKIVGCQRKNICIVVVNEHATEKGVVKWLFDVARGEVTADCPREVRFLGNARIDEICYQAVDSFEFRTW